MEISYSLDFAIRRHRRGRNKAAAPACEPGGGSIPRVARLMALAIRVEGLVRQQKVPDYAEAARRGRVTRARMTQILRLLDLASDLQEQILFLPSGHKLKERHLRPIVKCIDWGEQRRLWQQVLSDQVV